MNFFSNKITQLPILAIALFILIGCNGCTGDAADTKLQPQENIKVKVPSFDANSAYQFIEKQVAFGPRKPNTPEHKACKDWLVQKFKSFGAEVIEQSFSPTTYDGVQLDATNIIARYNSHIQERVLLSAHWDTRPFSDQDPDPTKHNEPILGADDGGSGVGVLLEIARLLQQHPIPMGVDIVLFDAEDWGDHSGNTPDSYALGSQHWGKNPHVKKENVKYGILLDMVGSKGARFPKEGHSHNSAPAVTRKIWTLAAQIKKDNYFVNKVEAAITDDHYYVMKYAQIPMVDIINRPDQYSFGHYWHTQEDDMDVIDKNTLKAVGQVVTAVVYKESNKAFK